MRTTFSFARVPSRPENENKLGVWRVSSQNLESGGLSHRYANALIELAGEGKEVEDVGADLRQLSSLIDENADFKRLIRSPVMSRDEQGRVMADIAKAMGAADTTGRFLGVLAANRRLFALPGIIKAFQDVLASQRGEATAEVISAKALSAAQRDALDAALHKATGQKIAIVERVDPALLGGLIVRVGSRMLDNSLRSKLQRLRLAMKGVA